MIIFNIFYLNQSLNATLQYVIIFLTPLNNMPISLSNLTQLLLFKAKSIAKTHKKKLIVLLVVVVAGYIAKKKLTMSHVISCIEVITKLVQALPLPEAPKLRNIAEYEHPNTVPLKAILQATQLDEIKRKISQKVAGWQDLKQAITTSTALTVTLYNPNSLYFLIQTKYREQFLELNASTQFQQAMYELRKRFQEDIPLIFENTRLILAQEFDRIELTRGYDITELEDIFSRLSNKILESRFNIHKEQKYTVVNKATPIAKNMFTSPYEYLPQEKSILTSIGTTIARCIGGIFRLGEELLPTPNIEITAQRYLLTKSAYLQALKKAEGYLFQKKQTAIEWPNQPSKELFQLILEEIEFILTSVNFSVLIKAYSRYNLKLLVNRFRLLLAHKQKSSIKLTELLPLLYKILQQQFYKSNLMEHRDKYHSSQLKKALRIVTRGEDQFQTEEKSIEQHILEEIELKQSFQFLEKEFELKLFNERSGVVMRPKGGKGASSEPEAQEIKKLLGMMGSSEVLNDQG